MAASETTTKEQPKAAESSSLHEAAANGAASECLEILSRSRNVVNTRDTEGWTPLMRAVQRGHADTAKALLGHGADASIAQLDDDGMSALSIAVEREDEECCLVILSSGPSSDVRRLMPTAQARLLGDAEQRLWLVGQAERAGCESQLVEWLRSYEVPTAHGEWPPVAVRTFHGLIIVVPGRLVRWSGPLQVGAEYDVEREILRCDDSSISWEGMMTALRVLEAFDPVWEWVSALRKATSREELPARDGVQEQADAAASLLATHVNAHEAAGKEAWRWLLPDPDMPRSLSDQSTAEWAWANERAAQACNVADAAMKTHWGVLKLLDQIDELEAHKADEVDCDDVLYWTIDNGNVFMTRRLVELGADTAKMAWSELHRAAATGDGAGTDAAIASGIDVNAVDSIGRSALWIAAAQNCPAIVGKLAAAGANVDQEDHRGFAPVWIAAHRGNEAVIEMVQGVGANLDAGDFMGRTALAAAATFGITATVEQLILLGADVHKPDEDGCTPAWHAAHHNQLEALDRLLNAGADCDQANKQQHTPLWTAAKRGHAAIVERLVAAGADVNKRDASGTSPAEAAGSSAAAAEVRRIVAARDMDDGDKE